MRRTYAHNGIIFGVLAGIGVYALTESIVLAILALIGISVLAFVIIRLIENLLYKGADKIGEKISEASARRKQEKAEQNGENRF